MDAEQEFAAVAFDILNVDALMQVLKELDPITILSLCQTNQRFAQICQDQDVFRNLMHLHYPNFPVDEDAKAQYGAITSAEGVTYSVNIRRQMIRVVRSAIEAYVNEGVYVNTKTKEIEWTDDTTQQLVNFNILGTRIHKGEKLWLMIIIMKNPRTGIAIIGEVFSNKEDAVRAISIFDEGKIEMYINSIWQKYKRSKMKSNLERAAVRAGEMMTTEDYAAIRMEEIVRDHNLTYTEDDLEFLLFLKGNDYPSPLTSDGIYEHIMKTNYFRGVPGMIAIGHKNKYLLPAEFIVVEIIIA